MNELQVYLRIYIILLAGTLSLGVRAVDCDAVQARIDAEYSTEYDEYEDAEYLGILDEYLECTEDGENTDR